MASTTASPVQDSIAPVTMSRVTMPRALAVDDDQLEHLVAGVHLDGAGRHLTLQGLVGADQQLLARLAAGVEGALHLDAAERAVVEQAAVLTGERDALGDALVDDVRADLGEPVHVGLAGAVVAALDRVVEQPERRVVVVAVVLGRVDAALGGDGVRAAGAVLVAEVLDVVAGLAQRRRGGAAGQAGAHDDDGQLAAVGRVDQVGLRTCAATTSSRWDACGRLGVGDVVADGEEVGRVGHCLVISFIHPNENGQRRDDEADVEQDGDHLAGPLRTPRARSDVLAPSVVSALHTPWRTCMHTATSQTAYSRDHPPLLEAQHDTSRRAVAVAAKPGVIALTVNCSRWKTRKPARMTPPQRMVRAE